jgi:hypothetical protein
VLSPDGSKDHGVVIPKKTYDSLIKLLDRSTPHIKQMAERLRTWHENINTYGEKLLPTVEAELITGIGQVSKALAPLIVSYARVPSSF